MNGQVYSITLAQLMDLLPKHTILTPTGLETMRSAGAVSDVILAGMYQDQPLCFLGFVPVTLSSDTAYMWLLTTPAAEQHRLIFARHSRIVVDRMLNRWPRIVGNCITRPAIQWLSWLGAEFNHSGQFELRRAP